MQAREWWYMLVKMINVCLDIYNCIIPNKNINLIWCEIQFTYTCVSENELRCELQVSNSNIPDLIYLQYDSCRVGVRECERECKAIIVNSTQKKHFLLESPIH